MLCETYLWYSYDLWRLNKKMLIEYLERKSHNASTSGHENFVFNHLAQSSMWCRVYLVLSSKFSVVAGSHRAFPKHYDVIKWKYFPRYWPFVREIHRSPVNSPHKGQWRGALMFSLTCAWIHGWVNNRTAGDLRRHRAHYVVTVTSCA